MLYADLYWGQVAQGLDIGIGRYVSLPDIETHLALDNYTYSHAARRSTIVEPGELTAASVAAGRLKPQLFELARCRQLRMGVSEGTLRQRPQAELTIERQAAQDSSHLLALKCFRFSHQMFDAGLAAKRARNTDG
jgi:hypothetical protein